MSHERDPDKGLWEVKGRKEKMSTGRFQGEFHEGSGISAGARRERSCSVTNHAFPTQELNPGFTTLRADSLPAELQGKPKNTGVVAYPFSSRSS